MAPEVAGSSLIGEAESRFDTAKLLRGAGRALVVPAYVVAIVVVWELYVRLGHVRSFLLPSPAATGDELRSLSSNGSLWSNGAYTLENLAFGLLIGGAIGIALGAVLGTVRAVRDALTPLLVTFQAAPKIVLAPLFVIWFGLGRSSQLVLITSLAFFPIMLATQLGFSEVGKEFDQLGDLLALSRLRRIRLIHLPAALPQIFSGFRVASIDALTGAILAEFITSDRGLGYLIVSGSATYNSAQLVAGVVATIVLGLLVYFAVVLAEHRLLTRYR